MAKRVILKEGNELIYPYVAPDVTLKTKDVPAEAKAVGEALEFLELKLGNKVASSNNVTDNKLPFDVPKVKITSSSLNPNATNNTISPLSYTTNPYSAGNPVGDVDTEEVRLDFISSTVNFTDYIEINYQGKTSLADAKKGFGIDLRDKHKFGYWREYDSFHLKAFYEDFCKCRDWVCNMLMEQIYVSREPLERRPFQKYNDFTGVSSFYTSNAYCHVEGFPVELYINDVYWGLYIWRTKKNRDNYMFNKSNTNHIFLDSQDWFSNSGSFKWTGVEIRNPKSDSGNTSFEEGIEPNAGEVKTIVETWKDFMWGITTSTSKSDIEEHMNMDEWIDVYLLLYVVNAWDSWSRNTLYGTWDGQHFSPMIYDLNNSFNGFGGKNTGSYTAYYKPDSDTYNQKARSMSWFSVLETLYHDEIVERYAELKNKGIFTAQNIINLFEKFIMIVGQDVYKRDAERWPNCPSLVANNRDYDSIETLNNWISSRMDYMDSQMV